MLITRKSLLSGIERTRDLDVSNLQMHQYTQGANIALVFSHLSSGDREFIKSGTTEEEWEDLFISEEDDQDIDGEIEHD